MLTVDTVRVETVSVLLYAEGTGGIKPGRDLIW